jgi:hypothetical protein
VATWKQWQAAARQADGYGEFFRLGTWPARVWAAGLTVALVLSATIPVWAWPINWVAIWIGTRVCWAWFQLQRRAAIWPPENPDRYDVGINYLVRNPAQLHDAWCDGAWCDGAATLCRSGDPELWDASRLFSFCRRRGPCSSRNVGCLTQVHQDSSCKVDGPPELTEAVRADKRLPDSIDQDAFIGLRPSQRVEYLKPFAEWQRRFDKELPRE